MIIISHDFQGNQQLDTLSIDFSHGTNLDHDSFELWNNNSHTIGKLCPLQEYSGIEYNEDI